MTMEVVDEAVWWLGKLGWGPLATSTICGTRMHALQYCIRPVTLHSCQGLCLNIAYRLISFEIVESFCYYTTILIIVICSTKSVYTL
jgi:hypothetical protein